MKLNTKLYAASGYFFGLPALYQILTVSRSDQFLRPHAEKALKMWFQFLLIFFGARLLVDLVWQFWYLPFLAYLEPLILIGLAVRAFRSGSSVLA